MRRALPLTLFCLLLAAAAPAAAGAAQAKARLTACETALEQEARKATFSGDMRTVRGAARLQVRFTLQARTDEETQWRTVAAPGFGTWNTSEPGIGRYVYSKTVENLLAPATYRAVGDTFLLAVPAAVVQGREVGNRPTGVDGGGLELDHR